MLYFHEIINRSWNFNHDIKSNQEPIHRRARLADRDFPSLSISLQREPSLEVCSHWRWTSWEKRYRLNFTDPCNVQTASLYLYFTIEGFIEISPLSPYINSKRHFYLSDKFSQVLGTSPDTAGKSGKESPRGGWGCRPAGDGRKTDASFALGEELLARYEGAKVTADKPRAYVWKSYMSVFLRNLCEAHLILWSFFSNLSNLSIVSDE